MKNCRQYEIAAGEKKAGCSEVAGRQACIHPTASNKKAGWEKVMKILENPKKAIWSQEQISPGVIGPKNMIHALEYNFWSYFS